MIHNPAVSGCLDGITDANHNELLYPFVPDVDDSENEHAQMIKHLHSLGIETIELFDVINEEDKEILSKNPNTIFTRDPMVTFPWQSNTALICNMNTKLRSAEAKAMKHATRKLGLSKLIEPPANIHCEGGDIMPIMYDTKKTLIIRTGQRTSAQIVPYLLHYHHDIVEQIVEVRCLDRVLHLDSALGIASNKAVIFDNNSINALILHNDAGSSLLGADEFVTQLGSGHEPIAVAYDEAFRQQATNMLNVGDNNVVAYSDCDRVIDKLKRLGVKIYGFNGHELAKGNGGPRCLTRPLY